MKHVLSAARLLTCLLSSSGVFAYTTYTVTNGLGMPAQVNTGLTIDERINAFVKNQDNDGYIYVVGHDTSAASTKTQSIWRILASTPAANSAGAWQFVLGGIPYGSASGPGEVVAKVSNTFYSVYWYSAAGAWRFRCFYATNALGQPTVDTTAVNPTTPVTWYGNEGDPSRQNVGAVIKRTSNDDLVYAGIRFSTDGLDLQVKQVATSGHTVTKKWEHTTTTNYNFYSTTRYDGAQNGRVFGVYCRNALNPVNAIWCVTNINQITTNSVWTTSAATNAISIIHSGGVVKNYDAADGYFYVYAVTPGNVAFTIWRCSANGGVGNWEPVITSPAVGAVGGYETFVKRGNIFFATFYIGSMGGWAHRWMGLTNYAGQFGIGGAYTNVYQGQASSWAACGQNMGALMSNTVVGITNIIFIGTARNNSGAEPDVQAVRISGTAATRTMLGGGVPVLGTSNLNDKTEAVLDDAYNGRAFFIFANYTNVYCATNIYANPANATNLFVAVVVNGMTADKRCSIATTTVQGKRILVVSAVVGTRKLLYVYNVTTLNGSPIYTKVDITPSNLGDYSADRFSVGFEQMSATSKNLYTTWSNGTSSPGDIYRLNLDNYDFAAIGITNDFPTFPLLDLPGKPTGDRPVDLEVVDLAQPPAVTGGTLVVFSIVTNSASTQRGVFMFNADKPEKGYKDITPPAGLNINLGRVGSAGSMLFIDSSMYGTDVKQEFSQNLSDLGFSAPKPANYPTAFSAIVPSSSEIFISWTDAVGTPLPDKYLIRASHTSYAAIPAPIDGVPVTDDPNFADGTAAINVAQGVQACSFAGLIANYDGYFKIYPYCGSGATIAYKTDGTVPSASARTTPEPAGLACAGLLLALVRKKKNCMFPADIYI
ncbi:MAG: hypothetical protein NTV22_05105 [bacterium]|nr:hypothetical protein [bacterium]